MKIRIDSILASLASCLLLVGCQDVEEPANTVPTVETVAVKEIGMRDAMVYGTVTTQSTCYFLLSTQPDLADAKQFDAYSLNEAAGTYEGELYGLTPGTTYYVAFCATDGYSEIIGDVVSFKTASCLGIDSVTWPQPGWDEEFTNTPIGTFIYTVTDDVLHPDYVNLMTSYANGKWSLPSGYEIGFYNQSKRVYAYYPYNKEVIGATKIHVNANSEQVLYGQSQDLSEETPNASIALKHAMARVVFNIKKSAEANLDLTIGSVNLRNNYSDDKVNAIRFDGYLNILTGEMTEGEVGFGHDGLFKECDITLSAEESQTVDYNVIPNSFSKGQALLVLYEKGNWSNSFVTYLDNTTWTAGHGYFYTVTVTPIGLQLGDVRVEEWENNDGGSITIN